MAAFPFLTEPEHFDSVRRAIDVEIDEEILEDEVIEDAVYLTRAAQEILLLDPAAETRTGNAEAAIILATIFKVAALLIPAMPQIITEQFVDYRARFNPMKQADMIGMLNAAVEDQIQIANGGMSGKTYKKVGRFALARGGRHRDIYPGCT